MFRTATVTILVENSSSDHRELLSEHGLSFHISVDSTTLLFDCGASDRAVKNAASLNIDLSTVNTVALSHSHYDHSGGFRAVTSIARPERLMTGPDFFLPKFSLSGMRHSFLGVNFSPDYLSGKGIKHDICRDVAQISENCWAFGGFERNEADEAVPSRFVVRKDGAFVPDTFADEICLALRMDDGLAVLVGCAHPGVIAMLETVSNRMNLPIRGVWGGIHLANANEARLKTTLDRMKKIGVRCVGFSHCSGDPVSELARRDGALTVCALHTGDGIDIPGGSL